MGTLLIGIGTSGLRTIEHVQNLCYDYTNENKPAGTEYIFIETNDTDEIGVTVEKDTITPVRISIKTVKRMITQLKEVRNPSVSTEWLPDENQAVTEGMGAGGKPVFGRLAMWGRTDKGDNFQNVLSIIKAKYNDAANATPGQPMNVFITGALTGGTGTGVFIDIAYLVQNLIANIDRLFGVFLIPSPPIGQSGEKQLYANAYGAFRALNYLNEPDNAYDYVWPNQQRVETNRPPFQATHFISQTNTQGMEVISSVSGLYKMAGLFLFLNMKGLADKRILRIGDAWNLLGKYATFGLSAIQYPKSMLSEYLALHFGKGLLKRWIDADAYQEGGKKRVTFEQSPQLKKTPAIFERMLRQTFERLDDVTIIRGGKERKLLDTLQKDAILINQNNHEGNKSETQPQYLESLYADNPNIDNYYNTLQSNFNATALNFLIGQIIDLIREDMERRENLHLVKKRLEAIAKTMEDIIKYWRTTLKIDGTSEAWSKVVRKQRNWMWKTPDSLPVFRRYKHLLENNAVLSDRMYTTLEMTKIQLIIKKFEELQKHIKNGSDLYEVVTTEGETYRLPGVQYINELIEQIEDTIGEKEKPEDFKYINKRMTEIEGEVKGVGLPILRIFPTGSFQKEVEDAEQRYKRANPVLSKQDVISTNSLWDYLQQNKDKLPKVLYRDSMISYREKVRMSRCIPSLNVWKWIEEHPKDTIEYARKALYPFLQLNRNPEKYHDYIPRIVMGAEASRISDVVSVLKDNGLIGSSGFDDNPNGVYDMPFLEDTVVFYEELGDLNPLTDLHKVEKFKEYYQFTDRGIKDEVWKNFRNPYIPKDQIHKILSAEWKDPLTKLREKRAQGMPLTSEEKELMKDYEAMELIAVLDRGEVLNAEEQQKVEEYLNKQRRS